MTQMKFSEEDKQKVIEFLNITAKNAEFKFNTTEIIQYFKLLSFMQQQLLPKIEANILEIKRVILPPDQTNEEAKTESIKKGKK
jgi:hypothetical protein